jgi:urease accessory protein
LKNGNLQGVGKHGRLNLLFCKEGGKTVLRDSFSAIPLHVFPPFYPDKTGYAHLYIVNPTSGLVGGDRVESDIILEKDAHVFITAPTATKVYRSTGAYSESTTNIILKETAALEYLPRYVIPFAGSMFSQKTTVSMEAGSSLFFLDAFTTGRTARREHLAFKEYRSVTEIVYCDKPVVTDRFVLKPDIENYNALGFLESYTATAALYIIFDNPSLVNSLLSSIGQSLCEAECVAGGVSTLPSNGMGVRLLSNNAFSLEKAVFDIFCIARRVLYGTDPCGAWERLMQ